VSANSGRSRRRLSEQVKSIKTELPTGGGFNAKRKPRTTDTVGPSPKRCTITKEK
jgi:hypothetical protein